MNSTHVSHKDFVWELAEMLRALEPGTREAEQRDEKILQGVREDDGAEVSVEGAYDEAIDDGKRGEGKDGAESFVEMHGAKEQCGKEDGCDGALGPRGELLQEIAAKDELFADAGGE